MKYILRYSIFLCVIFGCTTNNVSTMKESDKQKLSTQQELDKQELSSKKEESQSIEPIKELTELDYEGRTEYEGEKTIVGILGTTKGHQAMVNGIILGNDFLDDKETHRWKKEYLAMKGKKVEVKGHHYIYYCGPMEQCLSQGYIPYLRDIEYMKLAK